MIQQQKKKLKNHQKRIKTNTNLNLNLNKLEKERHWKMSVKCLYEDTGRCRKKPDCMNIHPQNTCKTHSMIGSCPIESSCVHRHPHGVCYGWDKYGTCHAGDNCRYRHPFERVLSSPYRSFLGHRSPSQKVGLGGQWQVRRWSDKHHPDRHGRRGNHY